MKIKVFYAAAVLVSVLAGCGGIARNTLKPDFIVQIQPITKDLPTTFFMEANASHEINRDRECILELRAEKKAGIEIFFIKWSGKFKSLPEGIYRIGNVIEPLPEEKQEIFALHMKKLGIKGYSITTHVKYL